jgi:hypothetical protein
VRWAIVIGVDDYGDDRLRLNGAVDDAHRFGEWVGSDAGGGVPAANLTLLADPTKDDIVTAISEVVSAVEKAATAERLYFYFSGHGLTARVGGRDESALVTPGFSELHTDHSLAIRSLTEHFETTPLADQFFFLDACRDIPWEDREFEIGRWPLPRRRDPGAPPVQQFILYATSPGRRAEEVGFPDEAQGAFSGVLMDGLAGLGKAKAWSWERNCYEVRWDRLAGYVHDEMDKARPKSVPPERWAGQIPQDTGSRGVAGGDRDPPVVSYPSGRFPSLGLTVGLEADGEYRDAEVSVLDAIGNPVVSAIKVTGDSQKFTLPPRTYAVRALTAEPGSLVGTLRAPVDLYDDDAIVPLRLRSPSEPVVPADVAASGQEAPPGTIAIRWRDPLGVFEIRDETGRVVDLVRAGDERSLAPGFYRVREIAPEETPEPEFVMLAAGATPDVDLRPAPPPAAVAALARALGGAVEGGWVHLPGATEPAAGAQPSTIVAAAVGATLSGHAVPGLFPRPPDESGVAVLAVAADGDADRVRSLSVATWPLGEHVPADHTRLEPTAAGVGTFLRPVGQPARHWVSIWEGAGDPIVVSVPVLADRLATLVVQLDAGRLRLHQFHPQLGEHPSSSPDRMRRVEYLQRLLLAGRLDGAEALAQELAAAAADDPLAGLEAGYVLLRLGRHSALEGLLGSLRDLPSGISDAHILRGECEAARRGSDAGIQSFLDAVNAGIPVFAEGLTRQVEGLRAAGFAHPRGALVRHLFQQHARGSMWTAFSPIRKAEPGKLLVSGADLGFEG